MSASSSSEPGGLAPSAEQSDSSIASESELFGQGAKWRGWLHGYGEVSYEFLLNIPSIPPGVTQARKELELGEATWARTAHCVCKPLNLDESVVVSSDSSARLLLQSLVKPDLGRLCLREYRKEKVHFLVGGDESWTPADPPSVEVSLVKRGPKINRGPLGVEQEQELGDMLVYAAQGGRLEDVDHLLVQHKDLTVTGTATFGPSKGLTPLAAAAERGKLDVVEYLLDKKKAPVGTALASACRKHDNHAVIRKLIQCGAAAEEGVQIVCTRGDSATLQLLLEFQTSLPSLESGLLVSAKNGHGSCLVKILSILQGSYRRAETLTEALNAACRAGRTSTIKILLNHGADPYLKAESDGKTAFDSAELQENQHIVDEILAKWKKPKVGRNVLAEIQAKNAGINPEVVVNSPLRAG
ncbi:unnamed protein product [Amoebophrya sp. A120]|nr:unnamed protein product [Amoebophrya sp. A120]|eukprot:GSA120T00000253001.1